ncbi:hypothetical protein [Luteibacter sp. UNC138MFCol5.1]|uniref:hypothetical protein n=1 Tax=Luteibacter sp. UNC138MFCol5.1 TaxID=1502774 RepID=UPI0011605F47|nr:hypothetical protein [Luteibacter sp. UNC138MFCol5.1]
MKRQVAMFAVALAVTCSSVAGNARADPREKSPKLGPQYRKAETVMEFRRMLLADGWIPEENPDCLEAVIGGDYEETCRDDPEGRLCRVCTLVPEIAVSTGSGHTILAYTKEGTRLYVELYGAIGDIDKPPPNDLGIMDWRFH